MRFVFEVNDRLAQQLLDLQRHYRASCEEMVNAICVVNNHNYRVNCDDNGYRVDVDYTHNACGFGDAFDPYAYLNRRSQKSIYEKFTINPNTPIPHENIVKDIIDNLNEKS
jgi:hypothetical protein